MEASIGTSFATDGGPWGAPGAGQAQGENIKLIPKIRPSTTTGKRDSVRYVGHKALALDTAGPDGVIREGSRWEFDYVAGPKTKQGTFFKVVGQPTVDHFLGGYNAAIMAYGQTGSGKTYTMLGGSGPLLVPKPAGADAAGTSNGAGRDELSVEAGIVPRVLHYVFERVRPGDTTSPAVGSSEDEPPETEGGAPLIAEAQQQQQRAQQQQQQGGSQEDDPPAPDSPPEMPIPWSGIPRTPGPLPTPLLPNRTPASRSRIPTPARLPPRAGPQTPGAVVAPSQLPGTPQQALVTPARRPPVPVFRAASPGPAAAARPAGTLAQRQQEAAALAAAAGRGLAAQGAGGAAVGAGSGASTGCASGQTQYLLKCSMLQIYKEVVTDLLNPRSGRLALRENLQDGVTVVGLDEVTVTSAREALQLLAHGTTNRAVAETASNPVSSRSHCLLTLTMEAREPLPEPGMGARIRRSRLHLVDLAGSERTAKGSSVDAERQKEAHAINKSLSTLGLVIARLAKTQAHVPYRDSKLTFLLQNCLGGNAKTLIIANINPSPLCFSETTMTLQFATRARSVRNKAVVNEDHTGDTVLLQGEVRRLREEVALLQATLAAGAQPPLPLTAPPGSPAHPLAARGRELDEPARGAAGEVDEASSARAEARAAGAAAAAEEVAGAAAAAAAAAQAAAAAAKEQLLRAVKVNQALEERLAKLDLAHARLRADYAALEEQSEAQRREMAALEATAEQCEAEMEELRQRPTLEAHQAVLRQQAQTALLLEGAVREHDASQQRCAALEAQLAQRTQRQIAGVGAQAGARVEAGEQLGSPSASSIGSFQCPSPDAAGAAAEAGLPRRSGPGAGLRVSVGQQAEDTAASSPSFSTTTVTNPLFDAEDDEGEVDGPAVQPRSSTGGAPVPERLDGPGAVPSSPSPFRELQPSAAGRGVPPPGKPKRSSLSAANNSQGVPHGLSYSSPSPRPNGSAATAPTASASAVPAATPTSAVTGISGPAHSAATPLHLASPQRQQLLLYSPSTMSLLKKQGTHGSHAARAVAQYPVPNVSNSAAWPPSASCSAATSPFATLGAHRLAASAVGLGGAPGTPGSVGTRAADAGAAGATHGQQHLQGLHGAGGSGALAELQARLRRQEELVEGGALLEQELDRRLQMEAELRSDLHGVLQVLQDTQTTLEGMEHEKDQAAAQVEGLLALNHALIDDLAARDTRLRAHEALLEGLYRELKALAREAQWDGDADASLAPLSGACHSGTPTTAHLPSVGAHTHLLSPPPSAGSTGGRSGRKGRGRPAGQQPDTTSACSTPAGTHAVHGGDLNAAAPSPLGMLMGCLELECPNTVMAKGLAGLVEGLRDGVCGRARHAAELRARLGQAVAELEQQHEQRRAAQQDEEQHRREQQEQLERQRQQVDALQGQLQQAQVLVERLGEQLGVRDEQLAALQAEHERCATQLQEQLEQRSLDAAALQAAQQQQGQEDRARAAEQREEFLQSKLRHYEVSFLHRGDEIAALRKELAAAREQVASAHAQAGTMRDQLRAVSGQLSHAQEQVVQQRDMHAAALEQVTGLREQLGEAQEQCAAAQEQLLEVQGQLAGAQVREAQLRREAVVAGCQLLGVHAEAEAARQAAEQMQEQVLQTEQRRALLDQEQRRRQVDAAADVGRLGLWSDEARVATAAAAGAAVAAAARGNGPREGSTGSVCGSCAGEAPAEAYGALVPVAAVPQHRQQQQRPPQLQQRPHPQQPSQQQGCGGSYAQLQGRASPNGGYGRGYGSTCGAPSSKHGVPYAVQHAGAPGGLPPSGPVARREGVRSLGPAPGAVVTAAAVVGRSYARSYAERCARKMQRTEQQTSTMRSNKGTWVQRFLRRRPGATGAEATSPGCTVGGVVGAGRVSPDVVAIIRVTPAKARTGQGFGFVVRPFA